MPCTGTLKYGKLFVASDAVPIDRIGMHGNKLHLSNLKATGVPVTSIKWKLPAYYADLFGSTFFLATDLLHTVDLMSQLYIAVQYMLNEAEGSCRCIIHTKENKFFP